VTSVAQEFRTCFAYCVGAEMTPENKEINAEAQHLHIAVFLTRGTTSIESAVSDDSTDERQSSRSKKSALGRDGAENSLF